MYPWMVRQSKRVFNAGRRVHPRVHLSGFFARRQMKFTFKGFYGAVFDPGASEARIAKTAVEITCTDELCARTWTARWLVYHTRLGWVCLDSHWCYYLTPALRARNGNLGRHQLFIQKNECEQYPLVNHRARQEQ